ncbi:NAD-dependent epimerase/dehydratase family protein [Brachyspira pilosicoli]|uniref:NAD-dependent epimerase/dehydratase family protein n=1 Tax=Brachyspira pilosicoli TaxID=52584 RepID=UPI000C78F427|nr:NAD(P)-dependent oxidoreductase [Brachyspira pilosicoli]PLV64760.1 epimerase [Brachyspira pilosicoli SP16]
MINSIVAEDIDFIYSQLKILTDIHKLNNSNIFITGGTGLFGKSILNTLIFLRKEINFNIYILTRNKEKFLISYPQYNLNFIKYIEGDIRTFNIQDNINFDYIIHAATPASAKLEKENPDEMYSIILDGTKNIINLSKKLEIKKLLFTSSGAVYGKQYKHIDSFKENYEGDPITYYGKGKKISEELFIESNINVSIARSFAVVGPYLDLNIHFAMGNFIRDVINGDDIIIEGDGRPIRTYLYMADLVLWLLVILLESENNSIYNVGSNIPISIFNLAEKVVSCVNNYNGKIKVLTEVDESVDPHRYIPNNDKIKNELKLKENYSLEESIKRTIKFYLNKGN